LNRIKQIFSAVGASRLAFPSPNLRRQGVPSLKRNAALRNHFVKEFDPVSLKLAR
jgi:hypothetical protein